MHARTLCRWVDVGLGARGLGEGDKAHASVHRVSQLHSGIPLVFAGDSNMWFPFVQIGRSRQADAPFANCGRDPCRSCHHSPNTNSLIAIHLHLSVAPSLLSTTCCVLVISTFTKPLCFPTQHPSLPRVRDWSTVVASCHNSLSVWHQSVLAHVSCPLTDFLARPSLSSVPSP